MLFLNFNGSPQPRGLSPKYKKKGGRGRREEWEGGEGGGWKKGEKEKEQSQGKEEGKEREKTGEKESKENLAKP